MDQTTDPAALLKEQLDRRAQEPLALGLHFGLDEDLHHADKGLGSTDIRRCAKNPFNYFYKSWMNPNRPPDTDTESRLTGRAMHKIVFEGQAAFDALYMRGPNQDGMSQGEKTASTKAANAKAASLGLTAIKAAAYDRIVIAGAMVTKNPKTARAFTNGCSEVSFVYMKDGIRRKARFDYLKCGSIQGKMLCGIGDLKSVANQYENDFEAECYNAIARYRYDSQAAYYLDAAALLPDAIQEGCVYWHGTGDLDTESHELCKRLVKMEAVGWQWVFHQTEGAPITYTMKLSPRSPVIEAGRIMCERGLDRYRQCMEHFGPDQMWIIAEEGEVDECEIERMPGYYGR